MTAVSAGRTHNPAMTDLRSPLQAQIVEWLVRPGASVRAGDVVLIVEAMKMEHELCAHADGVVDDVRVEVGQMVDPDAVLVVVTADAS